NDYQKCIMRSGFVSVGCGWYQPIFNNVGSNPVHGDCYLRVAEFSGTLPLPGEVTMRQPRVLKEPGHLLVSKNETCRSKYYRGFAPTLSGHLFGSKDR